MPNPDVDHAADLIHNALINHDTSERERLLNEANGYLKEHPDLIKNQRNMQALETAVILRGDLPDLVVAELGTGSGTKQTQLLELAARGAADNNTQTFKPEDIDNQYKKMGVAQAVDETRRAFTDEEWKQICKGYDYLWEPRLKELLKDGGLRPDQMQALQHLYEHWDDIKQGSHLSFYSWYVKRDHLDELAGQYGNEIKQLNGLRTDAEDKRVQETLQNQPLIFQVMRDAVAQQGESFKQVAQRLLGERDGKDVDDLTATLQHNFQTHFKGQLYPGMGLIQQNEMPDIVRKFPRIFDRRS